MQHSITSEQSLINLSLPREIETPTEAGCAYCGSSKIEWFESNGPTGVYAPDGGAESRLEEGVQCVDCGAVAEEAEPRVWLAEAFQIVAGRSRLAAQREHLVAITLHFRELASALFAVPTPKGVN